MNGQLGCWELGARGRRSWTNSKLTRDAQGTDELLDPAPSLEKADLARGGSGTVVHALASQAMEGHARFHGRWGHVN